MIAIVMRPETDDAVAARRRARAAWPIRVFRLGDEPGDDLSGRTTPEERIEMMWPLAVDAWTAAGYSLPNYTRAQMPCRVVRGRRPVEPATRGASRRQVPPSG